MNYYKIGRILHYYDKIGVAVVELEGDLATGDKIKFVRGGEDLFEQEISSMQVEHEKIEKASKGDTIGLKVDQEVREGAEIFKLSS